MIHLKSNLYILFIALSAIAGTGCETAEQKPAKTTPAAAAMAPAIPASVVAQPAAPKPPAQQAVAQVDPVPALIQKVEQEFQTGQTNYATGHLEAAKANFDRAVEMLMQGPVDIKSDDRLQREFDKIVESIHNLEMAALKAGDGFSEQKAEPAPIDEANEVTFPVDPALKARAE